MSRALVAATAGLVLIAWAAPAAAQIEVEVDPIAYALNGFSLHVAKVLGPTRLNVGVFGADVPEAFHGNKGWSAQMRGAGIKFDYVGKNSDGWFAGLDGGFTRNTYSVDGESGDVSKNAIGLGIRGGYRLPIGGAGLYVAPWVSVGYSSGSDVVIGTNRFDHNPLEIFPTVHIGWRF